MKTKRVYICTECGAVGYEGMEEPTVTNEGCLLCNAIDTNVDAYVAGLMNPCRQEVHFVNMEERIGAMNP